MSFVRQSFPRATEPDMTALVTAIAPLLAVSSAGGFFPSYDGTNVNIDYGNWTGIALGSVQAAVTAAPVRTPVTDVQHYVDAMGFAERSNFLTILDQVNFIRNLLPIPLGAITPAQYIAGVKAKATALGS